MRRLIETTFLILVGVALSSLMLPVQASHIDVPASAALPAGQIANSTQVTLCYDGNSMTLCPFPNTGANTTNVQNLQTVTIPAGVFNTTGKTFRVESYGDISTTGAAETFRVGLDIGGTSGIFGGVQVSTTTIGTFGQYDWHLFALCNVVSATGASCEITVSINDGQASPNVAGQFNAATPAGVFTATHLFDINMSSTLNWANSVPITTVASINTVPAFYTFDGDSLSVLPLN